MNAGFVSETFSAREVGIMNCMLSNPSSSIRSEVLSDDLRACIQLCMWENL